MPSQPSERQRDAILLVDDEVLARHALADYLRDCGYTVVEAASSDEAVKALSEASLPVKAILCHAEIAGRFNGFELRQWVQQHRRELQVILSGNIISAASVAADLCEQGPQLARPYDPQTVVEYVKRLMAKRDGTPAL